jgi:hypothetical protein
VGKLLFYDTTHEYEVDGVKVPSVSEVLRFLSREQYQDVAQYTLDNAADRGSKVHKACELLIKYGEAEIEADIESYVKAFMAWVDKHKIDFLHMEKALACPDYAGRVDFICTVDGDLSVVDLKTVSAVNKTLVKAQLNGYRRLVEFNELGKVQSLYCLQLMNDGKYREYPVALDYSEFQSCLTLHKAMARKHGKGKIE